MNILKGLEPAGFFSYFEDISAIPRGSGVRAGIREYLINFAKEKGLRYYTDEADNVVIYKDATMGYEDSDAVILQSHTDIVWQKTEDADMYFENEVLQIYVDGDFIKAKGTTLGADDGLGVAASLAVLSDNTLCHPAIEAVFTSDEEIGLIGAGKLDMSVLKGKKLINMDAEEPDVLTVSCAGGSDFVMKLPLERKKATGNPVTIAISGLRGGHSGIQIASGVVNADILLGRILNHMARKFSFDIISLSGGSKGNAIPLLSKAELLTECENAFIEELNNYISIIKEEIAVREPGFCCEVVKGEKGEAEVFSDDCAKKAIYALTFAPNGVMDMSMEIENLVETSLNLGITETRGNELMLHFALRSNKESGLYALEEKMLAFSDSLGFNAETFGHYPPWEFKRNSPLQDIYKKVYKEKIGNEPSVEAIHAGLECGLFSSKIADLDAIAIGALLLDVHTTSERLSVSSTGIFYDILVKVLENCR